jgi:hypothetical protein
MAVRYAIRLTDRLAKCFRDLRLADGITHTIADLLRLPGSRPSCRKSTMSAWLRKALRRQSVVR